MHEKTTAKGNRKPAQAVLFFKYREAVQTSPVAKKSGLLSVAKRLSDERDNVFWGFPIRKIDHPTSLENAREIVAAVRDWLDVDAAGLEAETDGDLNAPTEEAEIIRDFRDMD